LAKKVLIIKTGRSETFAESTSSSPSLGDVLRSTVLLNAFAAHEIHFLTSKEALPLLEFNPLLASVFVEREPLDRLPENLDAIVNLEKSPEWVKFTAKSAAKAKFGFTETARSFDLALGRTWQEGLYSLIDRNWQGEDYVFHHPAALVPETQAIGLNWCVGPKWPEKSMSREKWQQLHTILSREHRVSWQRGFDRLDEYIAWIASCRTLITTDSLGLHLALAMKKNVIGLFGPTSADQVHFYGRGRALAVSGKDRRCIEAISLDNVLEALDAIQPANRRISPKKLEKRVEQKCEVAPS
jgi:heptosyltransferase II